jgi:caffeoyl-CoA O-methyltransferase
VFIDADKTSYPAYAEWAFTHLRSGGVIMADNAFLFGYLAGREPDDRASAEAIATMRRFHDLLAERCPVRVCLPTPDGLAVGVMS